MNALNFNNSNHAFGFNSLDNITHSQTTVEDHLGWHVAAQLTHEAQTLPPEITKRLRAFRASAMAVQKTPNSVGLPRFTQAAAVQNQLNPWQHIAIYVPLLILIGGLMFISLYQKNQQAQEIAKVDTALLLGDLPPAAYADPGFAEFLKK